jgi:hypothetical protein
MLHEGESLVAEERDSFLLDLLSIQAINIADFGYYQNQFDRLMARRFKPEHPVAPEPRTVVPVIDAGSVDAVNAFAGLFGGMRG